MRHVVEQKEGLMDLENIGTSAFDTEFLNILWAKAYREGVEGTVAWMLSIERAKGAEYMLQQAYEFCFKRNLDIPNYEEKRAELLDKVIDAIDPEEGEK